MSLVKPAVTSKGLLSQSTVGKGSLFSEDCEVQPKPVQREWTSGEGKLHSAYKKEYFSSIWSDCDSHEKEEDDEEEKWEEKTDIGGLEAYVHNSGLGRLWIKLLFCSDTSLHESCFQIGARGDNRILPPTDSHRQLLSAFCTSRKPHISFKLFFNTSIKEHTVDQTLGLQRRTRWSLSQEFTVWRRAGHIYKGLWYWSRSLILERWSESLIARTSHSITLERHICGPLHQPTELGSWGWVNELSTWLQCISSCRTTLRGKSKEDFGAERNTPEPTLRSWLCINHFSVLSTLDSK